MINTVRQILVDIIKHVKPLQAVANTVKAKYEAMVAFSNPSLPLVIIYQMGKVGSRTVYKSLMDLEGSFAKPILHLHFLSQDLSEYQNTFKRAGVYPPPYHIYLGKVIRKYLGEHQGVPIKIISLVRDPIAFTVSDLFENPYLATQSVQSDTGAIDPVKASKYLNRKLEDDNTLSYVYEWFDKELKSVFDIDVFADPFPVDTGYNIYSKDNVDALVIRLEDLSEKGPDAISSFLGLDEPLVLKQRNIRSSSTSREIYQEVLENISLDPSLCKKIYSSEFVQHFYSEKLISNFISRWTKSA